MAFVFSCALAVAKPIVNLLIEEGDDTSERKPFRGVPAGRPCNRFSWDDFYSDIHRLAFLVPD